MMKLICDDQWFNDKNIIETKKKKKKKKKAMDELSAPFFAKYAITVCLGSS